MSGSMPGEPFFAYPGLRVSAGDPEAAAGTDASKAVIVLDPAGIPSSNIIDSGDSFNLVIRFRVALAGVSFPLPPGFWVNFHLMDVRTGAEIAGSPFTGTAAVSIATPAGDSGPDQPPDVVDWYSSTTAAPITLGQGTYRALVHGHEPGSGLMFFHEGTLIHVGI